MPVSVQTQAALHVCTHVGVELCLSSVLPKYCARANASLGANVVLQNRDKQKTWKCFTWPSSLGSSLRFSKYFCRLLLSFSSSDFSLSSSTAAVFTICLHSKEHFSIISPNIIMASVFGFWWCAQEYHHKMIITHKC